MGPQAGEKTFAFKVFDVASCKETTCSAEGKGAHGVLVFLRELTRPAAALMRALDENTGSRRSAASGPASLLK